MGYIKLGKPLRNTLTDEQVSMAASEIANGKRHFTPTDLETVTTTKSKRKQLQDRSWAVRFTDDDARAVADFIELATVR